MNAPSLSATHEKLIAALNPSLRALALRGMIRSYKKSSVIINEGDEGESLFVLLQGTVKVFATDEDGREITYGTIEAGDYFGEMSLDGGPRSASVMTLDACICSVVTRAAVRDHLADEPEFALDLVAQVIRRARSATETARNMALLDVYGRVVATLESYQGPGSAEAPVELRQITHQAIASRVGASREMVSRLLKDLEKGGYIALGVKRISLLKKLPARW
ncbi:MAG: cyclic nucleotide-binding domain-containing protein [Ramlibacter sp.]|nr:cyclic nucleotide-binding domain-containing protein [Ramlibacter sp.]MBX3658199.1 cyclic nucleotide-binding domain-containing protein [Ramlibacter sp.]